MRFVKVVCLVMLIAVSGAAAWAGSIGPGDPTITINGKKPLVVPLVIGTFSSANESFLDPILIPFSLGGTFEFKYTGSTDLTIGPGHYLYLGISGSIPFGTTFSCGGTFFTSCSTPVIVNCNFPGTPTACEEGARFTGATITPGEEIVVSELPDISAVPEPGTILMFMSLVPAIGFAKKRWKATQSA